MSISNNDAPPRLSVRDYRRLLGISVFQKRERLHSKALLMVINAPVQAIAPPFIWFGDAWFADKLSTNQTLYCIPSGRIQIENTETFIQAMAHHCLDEILAVQPTGPYLFGGFCFDAWIAYEVALLLEERGHGTALVIMIECYTLDRGEERFNAYAHHCKMLLSGPVSQRLSYLRAILGKDRTAEESARIEESGALAKDERSSHASMPVEDQVNLLTKYALQSYERRSSRIPMHLVFGADSWHGRYYRLGLYLPWIRFGWFQTALGSIMTHFTPGNHDTILEDPNVGAMAQVVQSCIDSARLDLHGSTDV